MAKYLFKSHLNVKGLEGTLKDGGTGRVAAVREALASAGGSLECMYYAFGDTDVYAIAELPDNASAAAVAAAVGLSGTGHVETVVLIEPAEIDAAAAKTYTYRPPGG